MKLKKTWGTLLVVLIISLSIHSQKIVDYFVDMPLSVMPTLASSYRVELIENYQTQGKDTLENMFGSPVKLLTLDTVNQHISVQATPNARFEMKIFRHEKDTVLGIINTVCAPICSSYVQFYDTRWKKLRLELPEIRLDQWLKKTNTEEQNEFVQSNVRSNFIELRFAEDGGIQAKNNSLEFLGVEDKIALSPLFDNEYVLLYANPLHELKNTSTPNP
ncbi:MAG: DUF3256 family protein [Paludibacteraceae bacterium]